MNRSIVFIAVATAFGLAACTGGNAAEAPQSSATGTVTSQPATPPPVVTERVTATVTAPPTKPVIDSFGFGELKFGMTRQQAEAAGLIKPEAQPNPGATCTLHEIVGTKQATWVSSDKGVASITFDTTMTSHGAGIGATEAQLKAAYPNLQKAVGPNYTHHVKADDNPGVSSSFRVANGKVEAAFTSAPGNNCHN